VTELPLVSVHNLIIGRGTQLQARLVVWNYLISEALQDLIGVRA
jgi:hypothetical protein